jgi:hypothetical protein
MHATRSTFTHSLVNNVSRGFKNSSNPSIRGFHIKETIIEKSLEELYNVEVEKKVSREKLPKYKDA